MPLRGSGRGILELTPPEGVSWALTWAMQVGVVRASSRRRSGGHGGGCQRCLQTRAARRQPLDATSRTRCLALHDVFSRTQCRNKLVVTGEGAEGQGCAGIEGIPLVVRSGSTPGRVARSM